MSRIFEFPEPRHDHVNVIELRPRVRKQERRPPSTTEFFDQDDPDLHAADRCVVLTQIEAQLIASLLNSARSHLPSPRACDGAISLLVGKR